MKSDSLAALEDLAEKFADQSRLLVERERSAIQELDQHSAELSQINLEYQQALVGRLGTTPRMLAHRRTFVSGLTEKIDELHTQRQHRSHQLEKRKLEYRKRRAQHAALEIMRRKDQLHRQMTVARDEQTAMEESQRCLQHSQEIAQENDHG